MAEGLGTAGALIGGAWGAESGTLKRVQFHEQFTKIFLVLPLLVR